MSDSPLVSVIVLSWNSRRFLEGCLASVMAQTHPCVEVILVDNASTDGSADWVRGAFPTVDIVQNTENMGFCAGNNRGLKRARGDYVLFLNADANLTGTYIEEALKPFRLDGRIGMVAGKVHRFGGRLIDTTGQLLTRSRRIKERGYGQPDRGQFDRPGEVFSVCGAVALYRRALIESVSVDGEFFDEDFFAFGEDLDVGWRARRLSWTCYYQPSAVAEHFRGGTQTAGSPAARGGSRSGRTEMARRPPHIQAHIVKNRYLTLIKNETPGSLLVNLPFILVWDVVLWAYLVLRSRHAITLLWRHRGAVGRAFRKRRVIRSRIARMAAEVS